MSWRGRVIRRQPVAVFVQPKSIQEQTRQLYYLARELRIPQYDGQSWATVPDAITWLKSQNKLVTIKSVYAAWNGPEDALALVLPVGKTLSLNLYSANIQGTEAPENSRSGFVYLKADNTWSNTTDLWTGTGPVATAASGCLSLVCNTSAMVASYVIGNTQGDSEYGWWDQAGGVVKACYYVHPFFGSLTVQGGHSQTSSYLEEKVY